VIAKGSGGTAYVCVLSLQGPSGAAVEYVARGRRLTRQLPYHHRVKADIPNTLLPSWPQHQGSLQEIFAREGKIDLRKFVMDVWTQDTIILLFPSERVLKHGFKLQGSTVYRLELVGL
jgi:hypothetical protein